MIGGLVIKRILNEVLAWCARKSPIQVSGEGGERNFRSRLKAAFLEEGLGWPGECILVGEIFDLLLVNDQDVPLIYIETKEPGHTTSASEYKNFVSRMRHYPGLRYSLITNGIFWELFEIDAELNENISIEDFEEEGGQSSLFKRTSRSKCVGKRTSLDITLASDSQVELFFSVSSPSRYFGNLARVAGHKHTVRANEPHILEALGALLRTRISEYREAYRELFPALRRGLFGADAGNVCTGAFELWCERSYIIPVRALKAHIDKSWLSFGDSSRRLAKSLNADFGFDEDTSTAVAESVSPPAGTASRIGTRAVKRSGNCTLTP